MNHALGGRISKTVGTTTTRFAYGSGGVLGEYGPVSRGYVWMDDTPVAVVDASATALVHADGLNTPLAVTNAAGTLMWIWAYQSNPFGEGAPTSTNGFVLNLRSPGQYFDAESGLSYNVNRDYEPATGRYVQAHPIGLAAGVSLYGHVGSNPYIAIDPLGLVSMFPAVSTMTGSIVGGTAGYACGSVLVGATLPPKLHPRDVLNCKALRKSLDGGNDSARSMLLSVRRGNLRAFGLM